MNIYMIKMNIYSFVMAKYLNAKDEKGGKVFWSRGNGWVLGGLAEVLKYLPEEDKKYRPFYEQLLQEMSEKIASLQRRRLLEN